MDKARRTLSVYVDNGMCYNLMFGWITGPLEPNKIVVIDNDRQLGQASVVSLC